MNLFQSKDKGWINIGVDAHAFIARDQYPPMLFYYYLRHLSALIQCAPAARFIFFSPEPAINHIIAQFLPYPNVSCGVAGEEDRSFLSLYYIPDQLSIIKSKALPLYFAPRTIPVSLMVHNILAASAEEVFLKRWPKEIVMFYLLALELISASPAQLLCPSQLEANLVSAITHVPQRQISNIAGAAAIPLSFAMEDSRWGNLRNRLHLPEVFLVVPSDTLSPEGERELREYWHALREFNPQIVLVRPALRRFVGTILPDPVTIEKNDMLSVLYEPDLSYEEFLELIGRSSGYFLPGKFYSSAGAFEAMSFGVPVFYSHAQQDPGILIHSKHDLVAAIGPEKLISVTQCNADEQWKSVAEKTLLVWENLILA